MAAPATSDAAYVLHSRRYREHSLILEILCREHGRLGLVARHVLRSKQRSAEILQPFRPLAVAWTGRSDLLNLRSVEPLARPLTLAGDRLFSGFYLNELVMRFSHRGDPNADLFGAYEDALRSLVASPQIEAVLRRFELALLDACGYAMQLTVTADTGTPITAEGSYFYAAERGALLVAPAVRHVRVRGSALLVLAGQLPFAGEPAREAKALMRFVIQHHLGDKPLAARSLFDVSRGSGA